MVNLSRRRFVKAATSTLFLTLSTRPVRAQGWEAGAAWVAEELLKGAINYVGGQLMARALGGAVLTDVRTWIREAVAELEAFFVAKLDEKVLERIRAELEGTIENLNEYSHLQPRNLSKNRFLIEHADILTASLVPLTLNYNQAVFIAYSAMAYRFVALTALYKLDQDKGHILSAKKMVDNFIIKSNSITETITERLDPKRRLTVSCGKGEGNWERPPPGGEGYDPGPSIYYYCDVFLDGRAVGDSFIDDMNQNVARSQARNFLNRISPPVVKQWEDYKATSARALSLTVACYTQMCRKVGTDYVSPIEVPTMPIVVPTQEMQKVRSMPGAVVLPEQ